MNKRFLARILAGAIAFAATFAGAVPASVTDNGVSVVSASDYKSPSNDGFESYLALEDEYGSNVTKDTISLVIGEKYYPVVKTIDKTTNKKITRSDVKWSIINNSRTDADVISLENGVITAKNGGRAEVRGEWNGQSVSMRVYVDNPNGGLRNYLDQTVEVGGTLQLPDPVFKDGTAVKEKYFGINGHKVEYNEKDDLYFNSIVAFNKNTGLIIGIAPGTVYIEVHGGDGKNTPLSTSVRVNVIDKVGSEQTAENSTGKFKIKNCNEVSFSGSTGGSNVVIPETVKIHGVTYNVTEIASNAFKGNKTVKSVKLPQSIRSIGAGAFSGCKNLTGIDLSTTDVTSIGKEAFKGDKKLKEININGNNLKKVGKNAFKGLTRKSTIYVEASSTKKYKSAVKKIKKAGNRKVKFVSQD